MWQCDNCGYTDEEGTTFEKQDADHDEEEEVVQYCPECGSDEVFLVDDGEEPEDEDLADSDLNGEDDDDDHWETDGDPGDSDDDWN